MIPVKKCYKTLSYWLKPCRVLAHQEKAIVQLWLSFSILWCFADNNRQGGAVSTSRATIAQEQGAAANRVVVDKTDNVGN